MILFKHDIHRLDPAVVARASSEQFPTALQCVWQRAFDQVDFFHHRVHHHLPSRGPSRCVRIDHSLRWRGVSAAKVLAGQTLHVRTHTRHERQQLARFIRSHTGVPINLKSSDNVTLQRYIDTHGTMIDGVTGGGLGSMEKAAFEEIKKTFDYLISAEYIKILATKRSTDTLDQSHHTFCRDIQNKQDTYVS